MTHAPIGKTGKPTHRFLTIPIAALA